MIKDFLNLVLVKFGNSCRAEGLFKKTGDTFYVGLRFIWFLLLRITMLAFRFSAWLELTSV
jgi:hypothetical protein